jgi:hypothetical protein
MQIGSRKSLKGRVEVSCMEDQVEESPEVGAAGPAGDGPAQEREPDEVLFADLDDVLAASDHIATRDAELLRLLAE